ncbi:MAG TPA: nitrate reductase [Opitutaceae bacterium]|jgi:assimilatory nitrate reductase catalytic subunit|nr:nitrate reductase [Opitutaceae bacterium]
MKRALERALRARSGPMTDEMVLAPARFGLGRLPARLAPAGVVDSVCGYCSTGCSLKIHVDGGGQALNLSANPDYPVNAGMACPKGWEALAPLAAADRATTPLLRGADGRHEPVDWERALLVFCAKLKQIQARHGPQSVAFLSTGQIVTEEMALLGALAKFGLGIVHGDGNTRQCMATAVTAYKESFGFDAPPYTYADFEESDTIVLWGSNLCIAHPILWQRIARNRRGAEVIVVDPRVTETAQVASVHVPLRPKSDLVLAYGLARALIERDGVARDFVAAHTAGFDDFARFVGAFTPERVRAETGLDEELLQRLVRALGRGRRVSYWWTMGVNQSHEGTRLAQALINLSLMTGNIGRPGTGANSITGQCNAMGSRLFSNTTGLLGGRQFESPEHRGQVARVLGLDEARIPATSGWAYDQILEGVEQGRIKGLWVIATNPAHSWIQQERARRILAQLDFLVVQDMYVSTETAQAADLVLPAAGWGEKEGTFINSERRIGCVRKVARAPGAALSDFAIFKLIAHYWGVGDLFSRWSSPEAAFQILKELSRGQPCDFSGVRDYAHLEARGGIQWPWRADESARGEPAAERRLFADGVFPAAGGRARFRFDPPRPMPETPAGPYPLLLLTGRGSSAQWHTQTRTAKSPVLAKLYPKHAYVELHPADAARLGIRDGARVEVRSRRGAATARAKLTAALSPGQVFMPMHYPETNRLTLWCVDPFSRQPAYKACAVTVVPREPADRRAKVNDP